jgi:hypothetical protein
MAAIVTACQDVYHRTLEHLLRRIEWTPALEEPFSHIYLEEVIPADLYERLQVLFPDPRLYTHAAERHYSQSKGGYTRSSFALTRDNLALLSPAQSEFWGSLAAALTAPEVKEAMYAKLARDLAYRFGVDPTEVSQLAGYSRPTLFRETDGFEIAPHPDTRSKVVTMHLYLPAGRDQLGLGTALYRRKLMAWPFGRWQARYEKVKQFAFQPNSAYAFVVNNTLTHKSWHGRERLPDGAGVRQTLLNTFYASPREGFTGYLGQSAAASRQLVAA